MTRKYKHTIQPWESTEEVFTDGAHELGVSKHFSFEPVLDSLPARTIALILIYPTPSDYEEQKEAKETNHLRQPESQAIGPRDAIWLSQRVQNACGPYALLHAVLNSEAGHHLRKLNFRTSPKAWLMTRTQDMGRFSTSFSETSGELLLRKHATRQLKKIRICGKDAQQ